MTVGLAVAESNAILNAYCRATAYGGVSAYWVELHIGDPGAAGTNNPAVNTTRQQATFGSVAASGQIQNTVIIQWIGVPASETYTFFSVYDASVAGTFKGSGTITGGAVIAGDTFQVNISGLTVSITTAA
jgi:hypothetical protein